MSLPPDVPAAFGSPPVSAAGSSTTPLPTRPMPDESSGRPGTSRPAKIVIAVTTLLGIVAIVGMYVKMPYVIFSPGDATAVGDYLEIRGTKTYRHEGELLLLTVRVSSGRPNLWRYLEAGLDDDSEVIGEKKYLGNAPRGRVERASVEMMDESQLASRQAALTRLGYAVEVTGKGARVLQLVKGSPAARGGLRTGDVIVAINGTPVQLRDQVGQIVQAERVGTTFSVTVKRGEDSQTVQVTSAAAPSGPLFGRPYFGIGAATDQLRVKFPVKIQIETGDVSGPSGGLAFALTIIDDLTPGDLTGGAKVAVTGEIDGLGNVGEVGGVPQKAVAARSAGATLMLVPRSEVRDARTRAGEMKVVGVRTLAEALQALRDIGGASIPKRSAAG